MTPVLPSSTFRVLFVVLSGGAVLYGTVMISFVRSLREQGYAPEQATREGAKARLRVVLMTALVASVGFLPIAQATSTGSKVQRPSTTFVTSGIRHRQRSLC